ACEQLRLRAATCRTLLRGPACRHDRFSRECVATRAARGRAGVQLFAGRTQLARHGDQTLLPSTCLAVATALNTSMSSRQRRLIPTVSPLLPLPNAYDLMPQVLQNT